MQRALYVCYYDVPENESENRAYSAAAVSQVDYITTVLNRLGFRVTIVSPSQTRSRRTFPRKTIDLSEVKALTLLRTLRPGGLIQRGVRRIHMSLQLLAYLLIRTRCDVPVIVYHAPTYAGIVHLVRRLRRFPLILEVGEVYADVSHSARMRRIEQRIFKIADGFVLSTEALRGPVVVGERPCVVIHGSYELTKQVENHKHASDGIVHVVYAGTLDSRKGGAQTAVAVGEFLDESYHIHIIGFGSDEDVRALNFAIDRVSQLTRAAITYDGSRVGDEYTRFLRGCQVGLSTQMTTAAFSETSFPSKVLSYLSNGLRVVSVPLTVLKSSGVSDVVTFADDETPRAIARAIRELCLDEPFDGRKRIAQLDSECVVEFGALLEFGRSGFVGDSVSGTA